MSNGTFTIDLDDEPVQSTENTSSDTYEVIATINLDEHNKSVGCKWGSVHLSM